MGLGYHPPEALRLGSFLFSDRLDGFLLHRRVSRWDEDSRDRTHGDRGIISSDVDVELLMWKLEIPNTGLLEKQPTLQRQAISTEPATMRTDPKTESPSSEGSPTPKQDPLERRRLQNRLSQRNHRRKIRDRIAKLQERVIANELRAAAALNGWDQTYSPPYISARHHSPYYQEPELTSSSRDHSPQSTEPSTPFFPSCSFPQSYSTDFLAQPPESLGDSSCYVESALGSRVPSQVSPDMQVENDQDMEFLHDPWGTLRTGSLMGDLGSLNQPNLYVATESSLPHILHDLNTSSSQSRIIIIVSCESLPSLPTGLGSNNRSMSPRLTNPLSSVYQCQPQNALPLFTPHILPRAWTTPGPYPPCALHKSPGLSDDSFTALHI